jgi:hypothetical protein
VSTSRGNAGEYLVMAELLLAGFDAFLANRGNPAFDVSCLWKATRRKTLLRVKTTSDGEAVWNAKKTGLLFLDVQSPDDFVVICDLRAGIRAAEYYIVPTPIISEHLEKNHLVYVSQPGRDGKPRNPDARIRILRLFGEPRHDNPSYGYDKKLSDYKGRWDLLM